MIDKGLVVGDANTQRSLRHEKKDYVNSSNFGGSVGKDWRANLGSLCALADVDGRQQAAKGDSLEHDGRFACGY